MVRIKFKSTFALVTVSVLLLSGMLLVNQGNSTDARTRAPGEELRISDETRVLDKNEEFKSITMESNSTLIIRRARITVEKIFCSEENINTTFIVEQSSLVSVQDGELNVVADSVSVTGDSTITIIKGISVPPEDATRGGDSFLNLVSKKEDLEILNSEITCTAQSGSAGTSRLYGGPGGKARANLQANGENGVIIRNSTIRGLGGNGGDNLAGSGAGAGGDSDLNIEGGFIDISRSEIESRGGDAGSSSTTEADGGKSEFTITSKEDLIVYRGDLQSVEGMASDGSRKKQSRLRIESDKGSVLVDHQKSEEEEKESLSVIKSSITTIDAPDSSKLHQVDVGVNQPSKVNPESSDIEILWWAELKITDNYGSPLENAVITYTRSEDPNTYPVDPETLWLTDEEGRIDLEVVGRESSLWVNYFFTATEAKGGASKTSDRISFRNNQNEQVPIKITLLTLEITDVEGQPYEPGMVIGGEVEFQGAGIPGNKDDEIQRVTLYKGDRKIADAEDISGEGDPFSLWSLTWDTTTEPDGFVTVTLEGEDSNYIITVEYYFEINEEAAQHPPEFVTATLDDTRGERKEVSFSGSVEAYVTLENPFIYVNGTLLERDYTSNYLDRGKIISEASIYVYKEGEELFTTKIFPSDAELTRINESGGYIYNFKIDAGNYQGTNEPWPEGDYIVELGAKDDIGLRSKTASFIFTLGQDFYPYIEVFCRNPRIRDDKYGEEAQVTLNDPDFIEPTFVFKTLDSHKRDITFDFTNMNDYDSPGYQNRQSYKYITVTATITKPRGGTEQVFGPEKGATGFNYTFDVENIEEGEDGVFTMRVTAVDEDGLQREKVYKIRVYHYPPPEATSIPLLPDIYYGDLILIFPALIVIVLFAYFGLVVANTTIHKRDQKKKKGLIEKMREEKKKQESSVIEEEVTRGVDSRTYMERTGSKGDEDFSKQLESASKQPQQKPQPPKEAATPPTTPPKQMGPGQEVPRLPTQQVSVQKPPRPEEQAVQESDQAPGGPPAPAAPPGPTQGPTPPQQGQPPQRPSPPQQGQPTQGPTPPQQGQPPQRPSPQSPQGPPAPPRAPPKPPEKPKNG